MVVCTVGRRLILFDAGYFLIFIIYLVSYLLFYVFALAFYVCCTDVQLHYEQGIKLGKG